MATTISVALGERSYEIEISRGNLGDIAVFIQRRRPCHHAVIVTDSNVGPIYGQRTADSLQADGVQTNLIVVPAGETSKSIEQAGPLWQEFVRLNVDRKTIVI